MSAPKIPRPFGSETLPNGDFDALVEQLGVPHRARAAHWALVRAGAAAADAVQRGLRHTDPAVRRGCCDVFDQAWQPDAADSLVALLDDSDPRVRARAAHALACARCKRPTTWIARERARLEG